MNLITKNYNSPSNTNNINLTVPSLYTNIPNSLNTQENIQEYIGLCFNTYYRFEPQYNHIGKKYLTFKSINIPTYNSTINTSLSSEIITLSGYNNSISAVKNINFIIYGDTNYYLKYYPKMVLTYEDWVEAYTGLQFFEFFNNNTSYYFSYTGNNLEYIDSVHILHINKSFLKFNDIDSSTNILFYVNGVSGDVAFSLANGFNNNIYIDKQLKYNFINNLKYRLLYQKYEYQTTPVFTTVEHLCGVLYENGICIICAPVIFGADNPVSDKIICTCMGYLGSNTSSNKYNYSIGINSSISSSITASRLDPGKFTSASAYISLSSFNISYTQTKNILQCEVKIPKDHYNYSTNNVNTDGTLKKTNVYITKINIYNEKNEVIAIAKFSKPLPKNPELEYIIKFDIEL